MPQPLPTSDSVSSVPCEAGEPDGKAAALEALAALLVPLARLAVNEGLTHGQIDECLRRALVAEVASRLPNPRLGVALVIDLLRPDQSSAAPEPVLLMSLAMCSAIPALRS